MVHSIAFAPKTLMGPDAVPFGDALSSPEGRRMRVDGNRNTCHIWADDSEHVQRILDTGAVMLPLPIQRRLRDRGIEPDEWQRGRAVVPDEK